MKNKKVYKYGNHEKLLAWQMADELDKIVQKILKQIPKNEFKTRSQIDGASDSVGSNIVEGHYSGLVTEFVRFLRYSRRSCGELQERVRRVLRKGYINEELFNEFNEKAVKTGYMIDRLIQSKEKYLAEE
jgi:four helix bundle protein